MSESPSQIVRTFYDAVAAGEADAIVAVVEAHFAEEATISWPAFLPYGGTVQGARRLSKMFAGMAAAEKPVGPTGTEVQFIVGDDSTVVAELTFDFVPPAGGDAVPSSALERWTFVDGKVAQIRAYYWDVTAPVNA